MTGNWEGQNANYWTLYDQEMKSGALHQPEAPPPFTAAQRERVNQLMTGLQNYLNQEYDKYILGREPIANWDRVIAECVRLGARELEDIYNTANAPFK